MNIQFYISCNHMAQLINKRILYAALALTLGLLVGCRPAGDRHPAQPIFQVLGHDATGLDFSNTLHPTRQFNVFDYMYFYNGGGVGAGDFNNDGRIDLFFAANQGQNKLYLNKGGLHFQDITKEAAVPDDGGWST